MAPLRLALAFKLTVATWLSSATVRALVGLGALFTTQPLALVILSSCATRLAALVVFAKETLPA